MGKDDEDDHLEPRIRLHFCLILIKPVCGPLECRSAMESCSMDKGRERFQRTVPEIFEGVVVPEAGHLDERGPQALLLLRDRIRRTIDRLVMVGGNLSSGPSVCKWESS
jgi:hypothetical protein